VCLAFTRGCVELSRVVRACVLRVPQVRQKYFLAGDQVVREGEQTNSSSCMFFVKHGKLGE
jgi:hypothetical protein